MSTMDEQVKAWYLAERGLILNQMPSTTAPTATPTPTPPPNFLPSLERALNGHFTPRAHLLARLLGCSKMHPKKNASCRLQWTTHYQIIKGICEGVHYLHQQRIIHMDLKPQNVLLDDNMTPRIADFGLSRHLSGSQSRAITDHKLGTMGYMAPEFLISGEITFKTDIYSLGVIVMEILMGHKECSSVKEVVESWTDMFGTSNSHTSLEQVKACAEIGIECTNYYPGNRPTTWFIIRGILGDAEISNWPVTSDVGGGSKSPAAAVSSLERGSVIIVLFVRLLCVPPVPWISRKGGDRVPLLQWFPHQLAEEAGASEFWFLAPAAVFLSWQLTLFLARSQILGLLGSRRVAVDMSGTPGSAPVASLGTIQAGSRVN
ncbi:cysteine-rich receptor-like protein kinase 27 [Triticum aestivum]|uniref:cysteine-rich receptor-like protein kinase 27 n=1 Tax=Triticum aestivum TaxID=4565 RepID=UPI001D0021C1|nr:cysteine-rich receptor-like protein kinase 27 [Triticum aestivum]